MEKKATLFEYVYRQLVSDIEQGALRYGDALPSLHDLCDRFRVGIRTIRDVQRALKADGVHCRGGAKARCRGVPSGR